MIDEKADREIKEIWLEIDADKHHMHFLVQSVPSYSITKMITMIKILTAREVFKIAPKLSINCGEVSFSQAGILRAQ